MKRREESVEIRKTMYMKVEGVRKCGRPRRRWMDVNDDMKAMGLTRDMAAKREIWHRGVHGIFNLPGGDYTSRNTHFV